MTSVAVWLLGLTTLVAVGDWIAVATERRGVEYLLKPLTMVALIAAAVALRPVDPAARGWFVAALVLSLAGDVFLMLVDQHRWFVPGLASFLLGHVAYIVGLATRGFDAAAFGVGVGLGVAAGVALGPRLVGGASRRDPRLRAPVGAYITVISLMVASAIGSTLAPAVVGALLFYLSDFLIGWSRFVTDVPHARLLIIVTYHAAQVLLVSSLVVTP